MEEKQYIGGLFYRNYGASFSVRALGLCTAPHARSGFCYLLRFCDFSLFCAIIVQKTRGGCATGDSEIPVYRAARAHNIVLYHSLSGISMRTMQRFVLLPVFLCCSAGAVAQPVTTIRLVAPATTLKTAEIQPIREAKKASYGTVISVAGRVTVANEFGGPAYLQDATGGIAVYDTGLHSKIAIGDSVEVTGPYMEYGGTAVPGEGLGQISGQGTTWKIYSDNRQTPLATTVFLSDIGEEREGQLVRIENAVIGGATGKPRSFQPNKNYVLTDAAGASELRIDNTTNLVGAAIPEGNITVTGVVGQYMGTYQIMPRFTDDLGIAEQPNPGDTVSKEKTFDITTWNLEWFGDAQYGPEDNLAQLRNVIRVIDSVDADLYGLQEVVNAQYFQAILDSLPRYGGVLSFGIGQPQKMAFLYKRSVIDSVNSTHILKVPGTWGNGRYPLLFIGDATVQGVKKRIYAVVIHAKATGDVPAEDYQQRLSDAQALHEFLNTSYPDRNVIVLGDFNDDVDVSTYNSQPSPYKSFMDDTERYNVITRRLSDKGVSSYSKGNTMLDHILVSDELASQVFIGAEKIENPSYIGSYITTTSDHYPVSARLFFSPTTEVAETAPQNDAPVVMPNPVTGTGRIEYTVPHAAYIHLDIVDIYGSVVTTIVDAPMEAGRYTVRLDMPVSSGVYYCRLIIDGKTSVRKLSVLR